MSLERMVGELTGAVRALEAQVHEVKTKMSGVEAKVVEMFNHQSERIAKLEDSRSRFEGWKAGVVGVVVFSIQVLTLAKLLGLW